MTKRTQAEIAKAHAAAMDDLWEAAVAPQTTARTAEAQLRYLGPAVYFSEWVPTDLSLLITFLKGKTT